MHGDALIVYRKGLVLKRFCGMWMMGSQTEWNIWMGGSARTGRGEVHTHRPCYSERIITEQPPTTFHRATLVACDITSGKGMRQGEGGCAWLANAMGATGT